MGSCLPRLPGRRGWGRGLPGGWPGVTGDDPERSRLPPGRKAGKTVARDHRCSAPSPKGHSRPEAFREGTRAGVSASVPKCRDYGLQVRHTHRARPPRVGSITLQNRFGRLGGSVTAALSLVAQVVLSFSSSRSRGAAKPGFYREAARLTCSPSRGRGTFPKADLYGEPSAGL